MKFQHLIAALSAIALVPASSHADVQRVCRGGSLGSYRVEVRRAVKQKLMAQGVTFSGVAVSYRGIKRTRDVQTTAFDTNLTVGTEEAPIVSFSGSLPELTTCTITGKMFIAVLYPNGRRSLSVNDFSAPGTLLPVAAPKKQADD